MKVCAKNPPFCTYIQKHCQWTGIVCVKLYFKNFKMVFTCVHINTQLCILPSGASHLNTVKYFRQHLPILPRQYKLHKTFFSKKYHRLSSFYSEIIRLSQFKRLCGTWRYVRIEENSVSVFIAINFDLHMHTQNIFHFAKKAFGVQPNTKM